MGSASGFSFRVEWDRRSYGSDGTERGWEGWLRGERERTEVRERSELTGEAEREYEVGLREVN